MPSSTPVFVGRVESLRGVAAMMVAVAHALIIFSVDGITNIADYPIQDVKGLQSFLTRLLGIAFKKQPIALGWTNKDLGEIANRQEVPPRVRIDTLRSKKSVLFDTRDHGLEDAVLHRNLVAN